MAGKKSGQAPFVFEYCEDLHTVPKKALSLEKGLHGGFAIDARPDHGQIYYGMAGCGLLRISPNLRTQEVIELPSDLVSTSFHSTKIGEFEGEPRLFLPANQEEFVAIVTLDGEVDFILPRPEFEQYQQEESVYRPTDTALAGDRLLVADGYGQNYISTAELTSRRWVGVFGGKDDNTDHHGGFGTAHGMNITPSGDRLAVADRSNSRLEHTTLEGEHLESYPLPSGSRPCGIQYFQYGRDWYALVGSLDDPEEGRSAPIYILETATYGIVSTVRPKEDLGIELADHIHNVVWHSHDGKLFLVGQAWNPGFYFVLEMTAP